jgi:hypothetical protein
MKSCLTGLALLAALAGAAHAETPYERDQRKQLEKAQREGTLSPQVAQRLRWEAEWRQQHPGEPMPDPGQMQKLHRDEIIANTDAGFAKMRAQRQAQLQHEYQMSRANQQRQLDARHVTWTPAQRKEWDRQYDRAQQQKAQDYLNGVKQAGEIDRMQREQEERDRIYKPQE